MLADDRVIHIDELAIIARALDTSAGELINDAVAAVS